MKKKYNFAALVAVFFISSCSPMKYFVPYPTIQALPKKDFSVAAGIGFPFNVEFQKKLENQLDLQVGYSYLDIDPPDQNENEYSSAALYSGFEVWFFNREKSIFNLGLGFGGEAIKTSSTWQYGSRLTLHYGGFWERYVLSMYLTGSVGGFLNAGRYIYMGTGIQTSYRIEKLRFGLRFGIIAGAGDGPAEDYSYVAIPFEIGFVFGCEL